MAGFEMRRRVLEEHPRGRAVMIDTIAHVHPDDAGQFVVCGSHGGVSSGEYAAAVPVAAVFFNDAGGGKENAGCASLAYLDERGIAAGTVSHDTAMIGDALETFESGIISALNQRARAAGFSVGRPLREALAKCSVTAMRNETVAVVNGRPVVAMDSISLIGLENEGAIIVCGSHGAAISGAFAAKHPPALVVFNDAGGGRNDAGFTSLADLEREGIAAAAVSHDSARIGDALDAWENGVVCRVNALATEGGVLPGRSLREELQRFTPKERTPP